MRALILLALLGTAVAVPKNGQRIVGGTPTNVESYPFMSNMQYVWFGIYWIQTCGGSLITANTVLSAAHCYVGHSPSLWRVLLGTSLSSSGGTEHNVQQLVLHPQYNDNRFNNDIAIVRLASRATFSDSVGVVYIGGPNYNVPDDALVTAIGWGTLTPGGESPEQLQHVNINIISQAYCATQYAWLKSLPGYEDWPLITDNMLCAGIQYVGGKDACQGDSGGPLVHNGNVLVGITSWGYSCAHADFPGVNVRVSRYIDWIISNIGFEAETEPRDLYYLYDGTRSKLLVSMQKLGDESSDTVPKNGQRIVGGTPTTVESYPFMSNMQYGWLGIFWSQFCGGTLVTTNSVLTAAHCFEFSERLSEWRVRLGTSSASSGGTMHNVRQLVLHPQYDESAVDNDIAIVRLASRATFSDSVGFASIAGPNYNLPDGTVVTAVGWGALYFGGPSPEQLQHVNVNIISQSYCATQYAWLKTQPGYEDFADVTDNMLCSGIQYVGGKDACQGDSGGPLVHNGNVLVGITSWGNSCAHPDFPGVNVRVSRYTDWITSNA